jgi:hypothetical protein
LTNISEALRFQSSIVQTIDRLFAMGGGIAHGNVSSAGLRRLAGAQLLGLPVSRHLNTARIESAAENLTGPLTR